MNVRLVILGGALLGGVMLGLGTLPEASYDVQQVHSNGTYYVTDGHSNAFSVYQDTGRMVAQLPEVTVSGDCSGRASEIQIRPGWEFYFGRTEQEAKAKAESLLEKRLSHTGIMPDCSYNTLNATRGGK